MVIIVGVPDVLATLTTNQFPAAIEVELTVPVVPPVPDIVDCTAVPP